MKLKNSRCYASALYTFNRIVMQIFLKTVFSMLTCCKTNCLANGRKQTSAKQGRENTWKRFKSFERKGWKLIQECRCLSSHLSRWKVMAKLRTLHVNEMMTSLASSAYRNVSNEKKEACSNIIQHLKWPWNVYLTGEFIFKECQNELKVCSIPSRITRRSLKLFRARIQVGNNWLLKRFDHNHLRCNLKEL